MLSDEAATERRAMGVEVPMPILPLYRPVKSGVVDVAFLIEKMEMSWLVLVVAFKDSAPFTPKPFQN